MAERSLSVCDLDNEPTISVAQVHVTVDGKERTFDLCDKHLEAFRAAVAPFVPGGAGRGRGRGAAKSTARAAKKSTAKTTAAKAAGRPAKKSAAKATVAKSAAKATVAKARPGRPAKAAKVAKATRRTSAAGASNTAAVRAWAREQGIAVPERGRLGRDLIERFQAATAGSASA